MLDRCDEIFERALNSSSCAEFCYAIDPLFERYELPSIGLGRGNIFWRARRIKSEAFLNLSELDYPAAGSAKTNRLNDSGSPAFYASLNIETAISEINPESGELIQIAGFKVLSDKILRLAIIGEYANVQKNGYMHIVGADPDGTIASIINSKPRRVAEEMLYIDRFFAHVLSDPDASKIGYVHSRALGQSIYSRIKTDGIAFPSVKDRGGFNICVKANNSDEIFHNVACIIVRVGKIRKYSTIEYEIISTATGLTDELDFIWRNSDKYMHYTLYGMTKEEHESGAKGKNTNADA